MAQKDLIKSIEDQVEVTVRLWGRPYVDPMPDGGVFVEWSGRKQVLMISILPSGQAKDVLVCDLIDGNHVEIPPKETIAEILKDLAPYWRD